MANYLVTYDRKPGVDYGPLHKHLDSYPTHWHLQQSVWIVGPANSAYEVADATKEFLDDKDLLLVQAMTEDSAWWGYDDDGDAWIQSIL